MGGKLSKKLKTKRSKKKIKKDLKNSNYVATRRRAFHLEVWTDRTDSDSKHDCYYDYSDDVDEEIYREKCYDLGDSTLIFIEGEDDLDCGLPGVSSGLPERCTRKEPDSDDESSSDDEKRFADDEKSSSDDEERSSEDVETSSDDIESYLDSEKCYNQHDPVLTFVNGDEDLDFECHDWRSPRARMSCGHAVTQMSLTLWCRRLLDEGKSKFVCGQAKCDVGWPFEEVCKMALLTPKEIEEFEKKMFCNAKELLEVKGCPSCKSLAMRKDLNNLNVECNVCTATKKRVYRFCWQCLREWKGPAPRQDRCENNGCQSSLEILMTCPEITFNDVKGVKGCPTTRACPTCGLLIEHKGTQCKSIVCGRCRVKFCFVCLGFTDQCLKGKPYAACPSGVAPRQTSIPVWRKKESYF